MSGAAGNVTYEITGDAEGFSLSGSVLTRSGQSESCTVQITAAGDENHNAFTGTITVNWPSPDPGEGASTGDSLSVLAAALALSTLCGAAAVLSRRRGKTE